MQCDAVVVAGGNLSRCYYQGGNVTLAFRVPTPTTDQSVGVARERELDSGGHLIGRRKSSGRFALATIVVAPAAHQSRAIDDDRVVVAGSDVEAWTDASWNA